MATGGQMGRRGALARLARGGGVTSSDNHNNGRWTRPPVVPLSAPRGHYQGDNWRRRAPGSRPSAPGTGGSRPGPSPARRRAAPRARPEGV
eukprot:1326769-Alexandrium_andersonii.AAC.2